MEKSVEPFETKGLNSLAKQTQALIYGLAVGDALGVPVEFYIRDTFQITDMAGYGTHNQPLGTWSDDTSLTLALLEHLSEGSDLPALMDKFVAYREGYLTPYNHCFDIGNATNQAISRYLGGASPVNSGGADERDNGNGALMRISPLAVLLIGEEDFSLKAKVIEKYTRITHAHPRSLVGSIIYVQVLIGLLSGLDLPTTLRQTKELLLEYLATDPVLAAEFEQCYLEIFSPKFLLKPRAEVRSTGYVVDSLKAAIWCVGTTADFPSAVLQAVNLGEDTDTIGAITGTLAAAIYQLSGIPENWLNRLAAKSLIDEKINDFTKWLSAN